MVANEAGTIFAMERSSGVFKARRGVSTNQFISSLYIKVPSY